MIQISYVIIEFEYYYCINFEFKINLCINRHMSWIIIQEHLIGIPHRWHSL